MLVWTGRLALVVKKKSISPMSFFFSIFCSELRHSIFEANFFFSPPPFYHADRPKMNWHRSIRCVYKVSFIGILRSSSYVCNFVVSSSMTFDWRRTVSDVWCVMCVRNLIHRRLWTANEQWTVNSEHTN